MKKNYFEPALEIMQLPMSDVLTASADPYGTDKDWVLEA